MSAINAVYNAPVDMTTLNGSSSTAASSTRDAQDRFLKLLVVQMKNQDPLNPMDNAQVTTQIAQLNTVSGIDKLNTTLTNMAASFSAAQSIQATSLIGHGVLVPGSSLNLQNGTALFGADLPQSVDHLKVSIQDGAGNVLHSMDVGPHPAGSVVLSWDGVTDAGMTAANGNYKLVLDASAAGSAIPATPLSFSQVEGVSSTAGGVVLNLGGAQTAVLSDVKQIM
ncbi:flagellar hook assembly protein [Georgfuchsia toluolica]|uniref:Basal-body rod modification protein FlgD n=1 Tax=Georgfuchsia toluolica TaxID=424218 RepID=A0A916J134_9PROT|nr:flagellar hook assembly protein FlgD [Georgfuchsia toluolica]CAG4882175.1 flagellar hook assembly protein [Georgfuchsia toluolica]